MFGLASKSITDESYQENAVRSATMSGDKGLTYDSKNNLVLTGVTVVSKGNIDLKANNVTINSLETKSNIKHEEKKKSFKADLSLKGSNYSYGKDKLESNTDIVKQNSSQIVSEKDVNINANDKVKATSVDIFAKNDINISGDKGIEISTANNIFNNETKQSSIRISTGLSVNKSITETIDNVKNIKSLTDFSGDSYDITNKASNLVGAIKTGAGAANDLMNFKYKGENQTGAETLKNNPKLITVGSSISHNKSETKTHNENVEKSSLKSNNMNISSKDGNILISGTDIEVKNDLKIAAKKDITIKASEEKNSSSHSSKGINLAVSMDLSEDSTLNVSANQSKAKGNSNGTSYINSTIKVGNELKTNSENIALSGANVEANTVDIKAKNITIESLQNKSETKESTSNIGGSVSIDPTTGNVKGIGLNVDITKGNGNGSWTENQTTLITKNGGKIDADSLTNTGAVIASESENNKLKISANEIKVSNLEDNNKYENIGGGINFSASVSNGNISPKVPNLSVVHDKVEKEQITRATAINTEISLKGKEVSAEELGFNTDREKSQEVTKDNEKHLNADLHTDLANKENRDSIVDGYKKVEALTEIGDINKFKESMEGIMFNRFANNHQKEFNLMKDKSVMNEDKQKIAQKLLTDYLRENGYKGNTPEILLTDLPNSFSVDSLNKETREKRSEKIYLSINNLNNPEIAFSKLFIHEKAHMNTYDEGKIGEETSLHTREKVQDENKEKVFSEKEKKEYLKKINEEYSNSKAIKEQFAEARAIDEKNKEHFVFALPIIAGGVALATPIIEELVLKYGPIAYEGVFTATQVGEIIVSNPELLGTKDALIKYIEDSINKTPKIEETNKNSTNNSSNLDPKKNKPEKEFKKVNSSQNLEIGEEFGKLGKYLGENHPDIKINWSLVNEESHSFQRMMERNISKADVEYYVANGKVLQQVGGKYAFITEKGMAVLNEKGVLITTYSSKYYDSNMKEVVNRLFGK